MHLSDFITTLATGYAFTGAAVFLVFRENGVVASKAITNESFLALGGAIPQTWIFYSAAAWVILAFVCYFVQTRTRYGLHTVAIGSNAKSTMMSGVNVDNIRVSWFVLSGLFCGIAAVFQVAYQGASTLTLGGSMGFQAVAVCMVGGVVLGGGKGDALGAFLGAIFMIMLLNGLYKFTQSPALQFFFQGVIILVAIFFDSQFNKITERRMMKRTEAERALV
jgi:ribose transport system permease protein